MIDRIKVIFLLLSGGFLKGVDAVNEGAPLIYHLLLLYEEAKTKGWVNANRQLTQEIKGAETPEQRQALAQRLFSSRAT